MSRSRRKTPIFACCTTRTGEVKKWKRECNRSMRRVSVWKEHPKKQHHGDHWSGPTDGKYYFKEIDPKQMRK